MSAARACRLIVLLAALTALALTSVASALAATGPQNRVRAFDETAPSLIGLNSLESACTRPGLIVSAAGIMAGFCVATEGGLAPIAGGAEITADDLTGDAAANYGRFLKSLPASAEEPTITGLPGGGFKFEADVPASNIPGSYATYTKEIDADGVTTTFYKTTYAPDGSVVSVKMKYP